MAGNRKIRYLVPNSFTAFSLLLGVFSIFFTLDQHLELAAWLILWCALLDKLDGIAARLMNATSNFGVEFDSFADFVAFGLAPGFLIYQHAIQAPSLPFLPLSPDGLIWFYRICVSLYILCAGIRLATFNVRTSSIGPDWFYGFPSTYAGAVIASFMLTAHKYGFDGDVVPWTPLAIVPLGVLMLTPLKLPKIKARRSRLFNMFQGVVGAMLYLFGFLRKFPELMFALAMIYLVGGMIVGAFHGKAAPFGTTVPVDLERVRVQAWRKAARGSRGVWWWRKKRGSCPDVGHIDHAAPAAGDRGAAPEDGGARPDGAGGSSMKTVSPS